MTERNERTCPSCRIRHRVPRILPTATPMVIPITRAQLNVLYALAVEFIEAGGGEGYDEDVRCEECGRWSVIAYLDWLSPEVGRGAA